VTPRQLQLRDEILQVLFWLKGEHLAADASVHDVSMWTATDAKELQPVVAIMEVDGLIEATSESGMYRLTESGLGEGGRRFTEQFADAGLGASGHGECSDGCDCQTLGPEACHHHQHQAGCSH